MQAGEHLEGGDHGRSWPDALLPQSRGSQALSLAPYPAARPRRSIPSIPPRQGWLHREACTGRTSQGSRVSQRSRSPGSHVRTVPGRSPFRTVPAGSPSSRRNRLGGSRQLFGACWASWGTSPRCLCFSWHHRPASARQLFVACVRNSASASCTSRSPCSDSADQLLVFGNKATELGGSQHAIGPCHLGHGVGDSAA